MTSDSGGDNHMIQGAANIPLLRDKLAIRATAYRFEDSGYYRNVAGSDLGVQAYSAGLGAQSFAVDADEIDGTRFIGARIAALFQATENWTSATKLKQNAAFAEVSWAFLPTFTLTAGGRYFEYDRDRTTVTSGPLFTNSTSSLSGGTSGDTFKGNLTYKPTDNAMIYAAWSQGYRLGTSWQAGLPPAICDRNNDGIVDGTNRVTVQSTKFVSPDTLDNYERGIKPTLLDRRLSLSADVFRIGWEKLPFNVRTPPLSQGGCNIGCTANVGSSTSEGVELQANVQPTDAMRTDVGGSWIDTKLTEDVLAVGLRSVDQLPCASEYAANLGLQYSFAIGEYDSFVRADTIYVGKFHGGFVNSGLADAQIRQIEACDYVKVDLTTQIILMDFGLRLFINNLTNADEFTPRGVNPRGDNYGYRLRPRTVGLQLDYTF